ncbi:PRC-barrel domain containing protein [Paracoccus liaowanqingii]|uniref:PRC-barrel domain containing protein n=1 Tax=Paracoccus liaowanqingii TaxID=2560053 RepID=A0A4Z1C487_9RHOB|nr:PRC-barrel domain-containing protein [Paracoccus liaowanqingii]TGN61820.1 PRC-barrel domain containing protein [Paracoccus liaowanqingii]
MTNIVRVSSTAMVLALAVSAPAFAQSTWTYSDIDQDGNLELSDVEFDTVGRDVFTTWDADSNQMIDENEFHGGLYDAWDVDRDGMLTEAEYGAGWDTWFRDQDAVGFNDLDLNADAGLDESEFSAGLGEAGLHDTWAAGGDLGEEQFATALYGVYDADGDQIITQAEYDLVGVFWTADVATANTLEAEVISLDDWAYDDLYAEGISAEDFIDEMVVYDVTGEEIGDVEDIIIGPDGRIASIVAEVGGLWDIGDTHVSVPYAEVVMSDDGLGVVIPVTEETVGDYGFDRDVFTAGSATSEVVSGVDDAEVLRGWRASELIGDYARIRDGDAYSNYGYINDLLLRDGQVAAVVVQANEAYGSGYRAYPYSGYGGGWNAGSPYYDMQYDAEEVGGVEEFDYGRF